MYEPESDCSRGCPSLSALQVSAMTCGLLPICQEALGVSGVGHECMHVVRVVNLALSSTPCHHGVLALYSMPVGYCTVQQARLCGTLEVAMQAELIVKVHTYRHIGIFQQLQGSRGLKVCAV